MSAAQDKKKWEFSDDEKCRNAVVYSVPLGVWVVRETARDAFKRAVRSLILKKQALKFIDSRLHVQEGMPLGIGDFEKLSKILRQKRLTNF